MMDREINPNAPRLRPLGIGEIISRTFSIYAKNWFDLIILAALVIIPITIINLIFYNLYGDDLARWESISNSGQASNTTQFTSEDYEALGAMLIFYGISILASIVQVIFINGTITSLASESYLGYKTSIDKAFSLAWRRFLPLGLAILLLGFIIIIASVIIGIGAICLVPLILFPVLMYYSFLSYLLLIPVMMLERAEIGRGIARSIALGRARFWPILGVLFLIGIINFLVQALFAIPSFVALVRDISDLASLANSQFAANQAIADQPIIYNILSAIGLTLTLPLTPIAATVLYYDARVRVERLDVGLQIVKGLQPRPRDLPSPEPKDGFFTMQDFINMILLTVLFVAVIGGILIFTLMLVGLTGGAV